MNVAGDRLVLPVIPATMYRYEPTECIIVWSHCSWQLKSAELLFSRRFILYCVVYLLPPYLYSLEVLAVGIQQFIRNWSSSKDVSFSSQPSARRRWGSWNLVFGVLQGQKPSGMYVPSLWEHVCCQPSPKAQHWCTYHKQNPVKNSSSASQALLLSEALLRLNLWMSSGKVGQLLG